MKVQLTNPTGAVAFFIELCLLRQGDEEPLLPILWEDNYVTLLPGETRVIEAHYDASLRRGSRLCLQLGGINVNRVVLTEPALAEKPARAPVAVVAAAKFPVA